MSSTTTIKNRLSTMFAACGRNNSIVHNLLMLCCVLGMIFILHLKFLADILLKIAEVMFDLCDRFDNKVNDGISWLCGRVEEYDAFTGLLFLSIVLMLCNFWFVVSLSHAFFVYPGFSFKAFLFAVIALFTTIAFFVIVMIVSELLLYANYLRWKVKTDA